MTRWLLIVLSAVLVPTALLLGVHHAQKTDSAPFFGTTIGGYAPDPQIAYSKWLETQSARFRQQTVAVWHAGGTFEVTRESLGLEVDIAAMLGQSEQQRERGGLLQQLRRNLDARLGREDLAWIFRFDRERARTTLENLAQWIDRPAIDASVNLQERRWVAEKPGLRLNIDGTLDWLDAHASSELDDVPLVTADIGPKATLAQLCPVDLSEVLSAFETDFRTRAGPRETNIRVAAKALNATLLLPGATFSFNETVGPRIESRGYREAPVIVDDELEPGVGGGVCQVATTVHAAAVLAGLQILQRRSHSRPSGYAPMGLDATVIDGKVDLRFRNPFSAPLLISTSFPERYRLRVEIVGMRPQTTFEHRYQVKKRYDFYRRVVTKPELSEGEVKHRQKGIFGYDVISSIVPKNTVLHSPARQYESKYWPVPEVYWVGPNTELAALPPLPEGATGVQRDGVTVLGRPEITSHRER